MACFYTATLAWNPTAVDTLIRPDQHYSLADMTAVPRLRVEDLSRPSLSFAKTPFETVCAQEGIEIVGANPRSDGTMVKTSLTQTVENIVLSHAIATWRLWLSDFAKSTDETLCCDHAAASLDAELRTRSRPTADTLGRPFPLL